jgi:hypothetical protein
MEGELGEISSYPELPEEVRFAAAMLWTSLSQTRAAALAGWRPEACTMLETYLRGLTLALRPIPQDHQLRMNVLMRLNRLARTGINFAKGLELHAFGSFVSGLYTPKGDLDLSIEGSAYYTGHDGYPTARAVSEMQRDEQQRYLAAMAARLTKAGNVTNLQRILHARVPILKFVDTPSGVECDVSIGRQDGAFKSVVMGILAQFDWRFGAMVRLIKCWARAHDVNDAAEGTLNSYALTLMVVFHLQNRQPRVLPEFEELFLPTEEASAEDVTLRPMHQGKDGDLRLLQHAKEWLADEATQHPDEWDNKETLLELLASFFALWKGILRAWLGGGDAALARVLARVRVDTWQGVLKFEPWPGKDGKYCFPLEDPFDATDNCGRSVRGLESLQKILRAVDKAVEAFHRPLDSSSAVMTAMETIFGVEGAEEAEFVVQAAQHGQQGHHPLHPVEPIPAVPALPMALSPHIARLIGDVSGCSLAVDHRDRSNRVDEDRDEDEERAGAPPLLSDVACAGPAALLNRKIKPPPPPPPRRKDVDVEVANDAEDISIDEMEAGGGDEDEDATSASQPQEAETKETGGEGDEIITDNVLGDAWTGLKARRLIEARIFEREEAERQAAREEMKKLRAKRREAKRQALKAMEGGKKPQHKKAATSAVVLVTKTIAAGATKTLDDEDAGNASSVPDDVAASMEGLVIERVRTDVQTASSLLAPPPPPPPAAATAAPLRDGTTQPRPAFTDGSATKGKGGDTTATASKQPRSGERSHRQRGGGRGRAADAGTGGGERQEGGLPLETKGRHGGEGSRGRNRGVDDSRDRRGQGRGKLPWWAKKKKAGKGKNADGAQG